MVDFDVVCNDREHYGNGPHAHVDDMLFVPLDGFFSVEGNENRPPRVISTGTVWFVPGRGVHQVKASPAQRHLCYYVDMPALLNKRHDLGHDGYPYTHSWSMSKIGRASCRERVCQYV